jgi:subtilisin family serine protease
MHKPDRILLLLFLLTGAFLFDSNVQAVMIEGTQPPSFVGYVPDRIVVNLDPAVTGKMNPHLMPRGRSGVAALDRLAAKYKVKSITKQFPRARKRKYRGRWIDLSGWHKINFQNKVDVAKVAEAFKKMPGVIDAQPIGIHAVYRTPNDPFFYNVQEAIIQWHLDQPNDHDIDAPEAWDFETGNQDIVVAVLDTGVRWFHGDLGGIDASGLTPPEAQGNMWINPDEKDGVAGVDDDGNGFVDDRIGWDFVDATSRCWSGEDCGTEDNDPRDFNGHGTHVAGIVAALNNNGYALASTAGGWGDGTHAASGNGVRIMPLRIGWSYRYLGQEYGVVRMDYAADAFYYAADNGARMANASWGSSNSGGLGAAVDYFLAAGGMIFNAAGNEGSSAQDYLGSREDVIKVAATDASDCKAGFSNFGSWIDISAPGVQIWSTWHNHQFPNDDYIASLSGTSMASPMALSVAALIWSQNPAWTADQVKQKLFDTADSIGGLGCNSAYAGLLGAGRVNAYLAVGSCEGDLNGDGVVDGRDLVDLGGQFSCESGCSFDLTYDDTVNAADLDVFAKDFGRISCP